MTTGQLFGRGKTKKYMEDHKMKKNLMLIMAVFAIITFGTATSSHAFVGLTTLTVICVSSFVAIVTGHKVADKSDKKQTSAKQPAHHQEAASDKNFGAPAPEG